jgi:hypothetical protein
MHVKYLSFKNSSFALILFYVNGKATPLVLMGFLLMDSCLSCDISVILNLFVCWATPLLHMHHHHPEGCKNYATDHKNLRFKWVGAIVKEY